jgi:uncharacterized membrane protein
VSNRSRFPAWVLYALVCTFWWGLWGFLSKIGSSAATPLQLQILFTLGMLPVAIGMLWKMNWKLECNLKGASFGILSGVTTGLGVLAYYAALHQQDASVVTPVTGLFPLLTVLLASVVLRERLNKVQMTGMILALAAIAILSI